MKRTPKAHAYITRGDDLLVFTQPDFPEAGIQIPGGTVEEGETPEQAVLREAEEETWQKGFRIIRYLGQYEYDMSQWWSEIQERHVFHLEAPLSLPEEWAAGEKNTRDGSDFISFRFQWINCKEKFPDLMAEQGYFLNKVFKEMAA